MTRKISRRRALGLGAAAAAGLAWGGPGAAQPRSDADDPRPSRLDLEQVRETVLVAHSDLEAVQKLVEAEPALANACHDWGAGDFETALGAASHTGQKDIARYLLDRGARIDLFCATMLGQVEIVEALLRFRPELVHCKGPHGLSLMHHAEKGGSEAMVELLTAHGAT